MQIAPLLGAVTGLLLAVAGFLVSWGMYRQRTRQIEREQDEQRKRQEFQEQEITALKVTSARQLGAVEQMQEQLKTINGIHKFLLDRRPR